ncbi:MAG: DNA primase DnaG [Candidatus Diapherotrites archaeon]|nr:DNA primase DnaG [Candidatus Diapherotrites archaeon]
MAKTYINTVKYEVTINFNIDGVVEKHDIVGAVFGQSEGLLGEDLDLRELQKNGKIGRIEIDQKTAGGKTNGTLIIPSSLDMVETCILSAAIETVDKVGPYVSGFTTVKIEDTRSLKRKAVTERAKQLLRTLMQNQIPESSELAREVREEVRASEIEEWGPEKLPAGPAVEESDSVIVVEGRADVVNLLKNNIKNVVGMRGGNIPRTIMELGKRKSITLFADGDRGGELILRKLQQTTNVDFVARAPIGMEVEELPRKEIIIALRKKISLTNKARPTSDDFGPVEDAHVEPSVESTSLHEAPKPFVQPERKPFFQKQEFRTERKDFRPEVRSSFSEPRLEPLPLEEEDSSVPKLMDEDPEIKSFKPLPSIHKTGGTDGNEFLSVLEELKGTGKAKFLDSSNKELKTVEVRDLVHSIKEAKGLHAIVFDGVVTKRLAEAAEKYSVSFVVGRKRIKFRDPKKTKIIAAE